VDFLRVDGGELARRFTRSPVHLRVTKHSIWKAGSLRNVQVLAGNLALRTAQRYIEADVEAQHKVIVTV